MKDWPALDVVGLDDLALALLDDFGPTAVEERQAGARVFFSTPGDRDRAGAALTRQGLGALPIDVSDEDWAIRSQQALTPVAVGRIIVVPDPSCQIADRSRIPIVVRPSMGFGTGHHASTRLCLAALQRCDLAGRSVLDVGTGSGILAIAAALLGAASVSGLDNDPDAVQSANENKALNARATCVRFARADITTAPLPIADVVLANLTGALLVRTAARLSDAAGPNGTLILSGILCDDAERVKQAFAPCRATMCEQEGEWVCLTMTKPD